MFELRLQLQPPERVIPHPLERGPDGAERVAPGAIEPVPVLAPLLDEPGPCERLELKRDGAERHVRHRGMDVARRPFLPPHEAEDLLPAGRGDGGQRGAVDHGK